MIDTNQLSALISAFRVETEKESTSPELFAARKLHVMTMIRECHSPKNIEPMKKTSIFVTFAAIILVVCVACRARSCNSSSPQAQALAGSIMSESDEQPASAAVDFAGVGTVAPITDAPEQIIKRSAYIASYNKSTRCPNWVAWHLTRDHTTGNVGRMNNAFHDDNDAPHPRAMNSDYKGSGYSRGHMCPSGDNKWDHDAMYETFSMTNICPQNANLNSGVWNQIEISCRKWAERYGDVYIVCGPMFLSGKPEYYIGEHKVAVPDAFFKVVLCLNPPKAIGFVCVNDGVNKRKDKHVKSLDEVERLTGYHFFPQLPPATRSAVASQAALNEW